MLTKIALMALLIAPTFAHANQSGYIRHGEDIVVFKDGKKVGDWPKAAATNRVPADATPVPNDTLYYIENDIGASKVRCYAMSNAIGFAKSEPVSCVRVD